MLWIALKGLILMTEALESLYSGNNGKQNCLHQSKKNWEQLTYFNTSMSKERSALKCLMSSHKGYDCNYESAVFTHIYGNLCSTIYTKIGAWEGPNECVG